MVHVWCNLTNLRGQWNEDSLIVGMQFTSRLGCCHSLQQISTKYGCIVLEDIPEAGDEAEGDEVMIVYILIMLI